MHYSFSSFNCIFKMFFIPCKPSAVRLSPCLVLLLLLVLSSLLSAKTLATHHVHIGSRPGHRHCRASLSLWPLSASISARRRWHRRFFSAEAAGARDDTPAFACPPSTPSLPTSAAVDCTPPGSCCVCWHSGAFHYKRRGHRLEEKKYHELNTAVLQRCGAGAVDIFSLHVCNSFRRIPISSFVISSFEGLCAGSAGRED